MKDKLLEILNREIIDVNELFDLVPETRYLSECESLGETHQYDLLTHTMKAIEHANNNYDGYDKYILQVTLLFHDIGKKDTLVNDNSKIYFPNHNEKSVDIAITVLHRLGFSESEIRVISALIEYHNKPVNNSSIMKSLCKRFGDNFISLLAKVKEADITAHTEEYCERRLPELKSLIAFGKSR